jgi:hypothetical protein
MIKSLTLPGIFNIANRRAGVGIGLGSDAGARALLTAVSTEGPFEHLGRLILGSL